MKTLSFRKGILSKEDVLSIEDKVEIENFYQFKNYYCKYVIVKFADQKEYLLGQIRKDVSRLNGNAIWYIWFWDKIRDLDTIHKRQSQVITEAYIYYSRYPRYPKNPNRIEELYMIDSKYIKLRD